MKTYCKKTRKGAPASIACNKVTGACMVQGPPCSVRFPGAMLSTTYRYINGVYIITSNVLYIILYKFLLYIKHITIYVNNFVL